jgi:hypothetical protein
VATPETEDAPLMIALHGTAHHVETLVRQYWRAQEAAELSREAQQFAGRRVSYFYEMRLIHIASASHPEIVVLAVFGDVPI